jgi:hypothetical protein
MLGHVAPVRTNVFQEGITSTIRETRIGELGMSAVITNQSNCKEMLYERRSTSMRYKGEVWERVGVSK